jgi:hypothetical protein
MGEFKALSLQHFPQDAPQQAVAEMGNWKTRLNHTQKAADH